MTVTNQNALNVKLAFLSKITNADHAGLSAILALMTIAVLNVNLDCVMLGIRACLARLDV
jgi:hypothetical protein